MEIKDKSMRGQLVEVVTKHTIQDCIWEDTSALSPTLRTAFSTNLNFEVIVSDTQTKGDSTTYCEAVFTAEDGKPRVIDITVSGNTTEPIGN